MLRDFGNKLIKIEDNFGNWGGRLIDFEYPHFFLNNNKNLNLKIKIVVSLIIIYNIEIKIVLNLCRLIEFDWTSLIALFNSVVVVNVIFLLFNNGFNSWINLLKWNFRVKTYTYLY